MPQAWFAIRLRFMALVLQFKGRIIVAKLFFTGTKKRSTFLLSGIPRQIWF